MANHQATCNRWVEVETGQESRYLQGSRIIADPGTIYSYGRHFPLAVSLRNGSLFLLNGDNYSVSTARHQRQIRAAVGDRERIIIPFTALRSAGIVRETVRAVDITDDTHERIETRCHAPHGNCPGGELHVSYRHTLGASVFTADVSEFRDGQSITRHNVRFLSAFDDQEARPLYFLAELPAWSRAQSVKEAFEDLRPELVKVADAAGITVTRQGDIFAIPNGDVTRASLKAAGARFVKRNGPTGETVTGVDGTEIPVVTPGESLYGTAHTATEVAVIEHGPGDVDYYARGVLYHDPRRLTGEWRDGDHARRKMSDGKTWHRIVPNTVPRPGNVQRSGPSTVRAWTVGGGVD